MIFQRINFHDNKLPVFKENKAKGFVTFGADNLYPDFLVELFNKSPKHNAIVSAKASYVAGIGTEVIGQNTTDIAKAEAKLKNINAYETYEELKAKIAYDAELFNGFAVEVIWNKAKPHLRSFITSHSKTSVKVWMVILFIARIGQIQKRTRFTINLTTQSRENPSNCTIANSTVPVKENILCLITLER